MNMFVMTHGVSRQVTAFLLAVILTGYPFPSDTLTQDPSDHRESATRLKPRVVLAKPAHAMPAGDHSAGIVIVKFHEGTRVRVRGGRLVAIPQDRLPSDVVLLGRAGLDVRRVQDDVELANRFLSGERVRTWGRLFDRPEADLDLERSQGEDLSGRELADLNLYYFVSMDGGPIERGRMIDKLNSYATVEIAYWHGHSEPACADNLPATPNWQPNQGYLGPAPKGIDALYAWTVAGGAGNGVKLIDIERGWNLTHEDLPATFYNGGLSSAGSAEHGTAELGIVAACSNGFGVTGIANRAQVGTEGICGVVNPGCTESRRIDAVAINNAAAQLAAGDVMWNPTHINPGNQDLVDPGGANACLPAQYTALPIEWRQAEFDAIASATARGIIHVEAAGNGSMDLDDPIYDGKFDREVRDSGAIMVGAGQDPIAANVCSPGGGNLPQTPRAPFSWSNYGSRVDVHAWGGSVMTTGSNPSVPGAAAGDSTQWYRTGFGGTSSAVAIVAGAVASIQGAVKAQGRPPLKPAEMRDLLVATGTPQAQADIDGDGAIDARHIGPQPNLRAAINGLLHTSLARGYFNNDDFQDLAIGIPQAAVNGVTGAGKVIVLMGTASGLDVDSPIQFSQALAGFGSAPEAGDFFGFAVAAGDFDNNGRDDLAIGAPFEDVGDISDAGAVNIIYSDDRGLNARLAIQWLHQDTLDVPGTAQVGDHFGYSLASGDFDGNGKDDLAIGVPSENVGVGGDNMLDAGAVNVIYGDASGLNPAFRARVYDQSHPGEVPGTAETGDRFGFSLAAGNFDGDAMGRDDLAIGVPFEEVNGKSQAGIVAVIYSRAGGLDPTFRVSDLRQPVAAGKSLGEPGDLFGYALASGDFDANGREDLAIGVPGEDYFDEIDAGLVDVLYGNSNGLSGALAQEFHQSSADMPGSAEAGDRFGSALAAGDFDNSRANYTLDDLAIGIPGEDIESAITLFDVGAVAVIYSQGDRLRPSHRTNLFHQNNPVGLPTAADNGEHFGAVLAAGRFDSGGTEDLAIGVWGERSGLARGYTLTLYSAGLGGLDGDSFSEYEGL